MMKIHTTENLRTWAEQSTESKKTNLNYRKQQVTPDSVSFGKKKPPYKNLKPIVDSIKKLVGDIKEKPDLDHKRGDNILNSKLFDKMLKVVENEVLTNAVIAAVICMVLRPATVMLMSNEDNKKNSTYQAAHSFSSGLTSLVATFIFLQPFKNGAKAATSHAGEFYKEFGEDVLKRLNPHLDLKSIKDANGKRKEVAEWLDWEGKKFTNNLKDVEKIPVFKKFADVSNETYKFLGVDVDWASQKGKSFNDVVTKDGKKLYDVINWKNIGIIADSDKKLSASVLLRDLDREFTEKIIKNADSQSNWSKLDINSMYDGNKVKDFRNWKSIDGSNWVLDLDSAYISSAFETADYKPRISGRTRFDNKENTIKFISYLKNGTNGELGTAINQEMADMMPRNEALDKIVNWIPDIVLKPFIAALTVKLIPLILVKVFHLEKTKKPEEQKAENNEEKVAVNDANSKGDVTFKGNVSNISNTDDVKNPSSNEVSFKGKGKNGYSFLAKILAKIYAIPMYKSKHVAKIADFISKIPGDLTQHMLTLGSLVTSGMYVYKTMNNKDLEEDPKRTLVISQILGFIVPTVLAYLFNDKLVAPTKAREYRYSGLQEQIMAIKRLHGQDKAAKEIEKALDKKLKGIRIISAITTTTMCYRYLSPVAIAPVANWGGNKINEHRHKKAELQKVNN